MRRHTGVVRILVVEDDPSISRALERGLVAEGFDVDLCDNGTDGLWRATEGDYGAIVLDILLPGKNGYEVCREFRASNTSTPILMLTAKGGEYDQAEGLDLGADAYIVKPFSWVVLLANLRALVRRRNGAAPTTLEYGQIVLDPKSRECTFRGNEVVLTGREATVLECLLRSGPEVLPKEDLLKQVWGFDFDGDPNIVDVYLGYLRKKLDKGVIETIRGLGYRLVPDP